MKINKNMVISLVLGVVIILGSNGVTYYVMNNKVNEIKEDCNLKIEKYQDDILDYKKEIFKLKNTDTEVNLEYYKDTELTTGNYVVGKDIEPGVYDVILNNEISGSFFEINDANGEYIAAFNMGTDANAGYDREVKNVELKEGYSIELLSGLNLVFKSVE